MAQAEAAPLLAREDGTAAEGSGHGGATWAQTLGNVVGSIIGTGVLGLPYAFRNAGWLAGTLGVAAAGCTTLYCMLLLVSCPTLTPLHPALCIAAFFPLIIWFFFWDLPQHSHPSLRDAFSLYTDWDELFMKNLVTFVLKQIL